jgi:hypothetical protein
MRAISIENAFDDPRAIRALVERHGPYRALAGYLPVSATRGDRKAAATGGGTLPWFRGTWAANGKPLVEGAELILDHPRFRQAASQLFDGAEVVPNTIAINVNAPMPAGAVHVDIPSFRGATRDRYPIQLLQAMGSSGLFEPWRIVEAGAVIWFYEGAGGEYEYWPDGLNRPKRSVSAPLTNRALVADNDRMYHRIGWVGEPNAKIPALSPLAQITHNSSMGGWVVSDGGREVQRYPDKQIRISILWRGGIRAGRDRADDEQLTAERIAQIFQTDLASRGIAANEQAFPLSDQAWLNLVHSTYYSPVELRE